MERQRPIGEAGTHNEPRLLPYPAGLVERIPKRRPFFKEIAMYRFTTTMTILALGLTLQSAYAAFPQDLPSRTVKFADLDLSRNQDVAVLYNRLRAAAETVCAPLDDRQIAWHMNFTKCVKSLISSAVTKVDRPALTAYYMDQTSGHNPAVRTAQNQTR
jgi:UrcA family protein